MASKREEKAECEIISQEVREQQESDELDQVYKQNAEWRNICDSCDGLSKSHQPCSETLNFRVIFPPCCWYLTGMIIMI